MRITTLMRLATSLLVAVTCVCADASPLGPDGEPGRFLTGKFVWLDLATDDLAGARAFYGAVFGWRFREVGAPPVSYTLIEQDAGKVGGVFRQARPPGAPVGSRWLSLISVVDAEEAAREVVQRGGQVIVAPTRVAGRGTHAVFRDPQGAVFGVLAASDGDPPDVPVADGEVFWLDLFTPTPTQAAGFYAALAGYEIAEDELQQGRKRWILATGTIARAGVVTLPPRASGPGWLPYVLVDDVTATLARARAAGGKIIVEPRADLLDRNLAVIADPNGGLIGIVNWLSDTGAGGPTR